MPFWMPFHKILTMKVKDCENPLKVLEALRILSRSRIGLHDLSNARKSCILQRIRDTNEWTKTRLKGRMIG